MQSYHPQRVAVVSIWAPDLPTTIHFYRDVFGLEVLTHHAERIHMQCGETLLTFLQGNPHPATETTVERFPIFAMQVADLDAAVARLEAHNVAMPWGIESAPGSRWVMFHDPAGNLIELAELG